MSGNFLDDSGEMIGRDSQGIRIETDLAMSLIMSEKQKDEFDQYVVFFFRLAWMHGICECRRNRTRVIPLQPGRSRY